MKASLPGWFQALRGLLPVLARLAKTLGLTGVAADLLRRVAGDMIAAAEKTPSHTDDLVARMVATIVFHVADLLEQGRVDEALHVFDAIGEMDRAA